MSAVVNYVQQAIVEVPPICDSLFLLIPCYMVAVYILTNFGPYRAELTQKKDYKCNSTFWTPIMILYNIIMTIFSLVSWVGMAIVVFNNMQGMFGTNDCSKFAKDPLFVNLVYWFYISKYVEFADTLFLIVKGKGVSNLHYFHHCGAAISMGMLYTTKVEPAYIFVMFNGFVHTIMYAYYGFSLAGYRFPGKSMITSLQIVQFLTGFYFLTPYKDVPCFRDNFQSMFVYYYTYAYVFMVLCLFLNFFLRNYLMSPKPQSRPQQPNDTKAQVAPAASFSREKSKESRT